MNPELSRDEWKPRAALTEELLARTCTTFHLGALHDASDLGGTYNLSALLVIATGNYVLRVYRPWVTAGRLRSIQQVRKALAARGLPIPQPVATTTGETIVNLDERLAEVEPFVPHDHSADNWERYAKAFALLGSLHNALATDIPSQFVPPRVSNYGTPGQLLHWLTITESFLQKEGDTSSAQTCIAACRETRDLLLKIDTWWQKTGPSLPTQLLHGDYGGGNILFQGDTIVAVLDFDFLGIRERIFEIAYTIYWLLRRLEPDISPDNHSWEKVAELLAIYHQSSARALTQQEFDALPFEMARVPLYWIAEADLTPDPLQSVQAMLPDVPFARWLLDHVDDVSGRLR